MLLLSVRWPVNATQVVALEPGNKAYTPGHIEWKTRIPDFVRDPYAEYSAPSYSVTTWTRIVESCAARVQPEAVRASLVDPLFRRVRTTRVSTPMLVLGAADDGMVTNAEVRATQLAVPHDRPSH